MTATPPSPIEDAAKPFSKQSQSQKDKVMRLWDEAYLASGGDIKGVMAYYLYHTKGGKHNRYTIIDNLRKAFSEKMTKQERNLANLLEGMKNLLAGYAKDEERLRLLEIIVPLFSRSELTQRGILISEELWDRARKNVSAPRSPFPSVDGHDNILNDGEDDPLHHQQHDNHEEHHHHHASENHEMHMHQLQHEEMYHHHMGGHEEEEEGDVMEEEEVPGGHGLKRTHEGEEINTTHYIVERNEPEEDDGSLVADQTAELVDDGRKRRKLH
jgi:hypothetical protein